MSEFENVFERLRDIMRPFEQNLVVKADLPGNYYLNTPYQRSDGYAYAFGGVQIKKNYVSYHLLPVYMNPHLLDTVSDKLKKQMQGKSCFNFKILDDELLLELKDLTEKSFETCKNTDFSVFDRGRK
ncbi:MAG: hypothetical protein KC422_16385 [Trueperaceae bacterium]|nr:hypothetical protein [Trueperaceae bacterium]